MKKIYIYPIISNLPFYEDYNCNQCQHIKLQTYISDKFREGIVVAPPVCLIKGKVITTNIAPVCDSYSPIEGAVKNFKKQAKIL